MGLTGCAAPGEPVERKPQVPTAIADLAAQQQGNDVILTFTKPKETVERRPLKQTPAIEIYRKFEAVPGSAAPSAKAVPELILTIPPAMVDRYSQKDHVHVVSALDAGDLSQHIGWTAAYTVRTRASSKKESADSNHAEVRVYPAADPIEDVKTEVTHAGIILRWTPPKKTPAGTTPAIVAYHIYRAEAAPGVQTQPEPAANTSVSVSEVPKLKVPFTRIGETPEVSFQDMQVEFGATYVYSIRSVSQYPDVTLESADSNLIIVTPRDTFPPAAPQGLVVVLVTAQGENPAYLDISWAISPETDTAGYNVYRREQDGVAGTRLNSELLLTPAFRDMNAEPSHHYMYSATAVDRAGNESQASEPVSGSVPMEGKPTNP
jgi:fibronectin type 3 domain-containing protein